MTGIIISDHTIRSEYGGVIMSDRWCPYCESKPGLNLFGASYRCAKTGEDIYSGSEMYHNYCCGYKSGYSKCPHYNPKGFGSNGSGCYLTSACVEAAGLADDCQELTMLRAFRDNWLSNQPGGKEEIDRYYRVAPRIIEEIRARINCDEILKSIYEEMVVPCVHFIQQDRFEDAYALYRQKTEELTQAYIE